MSGSEGCGPDSGDDKEYPWGPDSPQKGEGVGVLSSQELPAWMTKCEQPDCEHWMAANKGQALPSTHYHCIHHACFSRGPEGTKPHFTCAKAYDALRHCHSHVRRARKRQLDIHSLWDRVQANTGLLNRVVQPNMQTVFRRGLSGQGAGTGAANFWRERLLIGKTEDTGTMLAGAIERFGTLPATTVLPRSVPFRVEPTEHPLPGHTIRFHKSAEGELWFGVCIGGFERTTVLGETGWACMVHWLEESHRGIWNGQPAVFYQTTGDTQKQLLESMEDWGSLLARDAKTGLLVLHTNMDDETGASASELKETLGGPCIADRSSTMTTEDLAMFAGLFPMKTEVCVDLAGFPCMPESCGPGQSDCIWGSTRQGSTKHIPLVTRDGPVFLRPLRYHCTAHGRIVRAGETQSPNRRTDPDYHRLGNMMYETDYLLELQAGYVDTLNVAQCRRRILDRWLTAKFSHVHALSRQQAVLGLRSRELRNACRLLLALEGYVPSVQSLTSLHLVLYRALVEPHITGYDRAVAAFDGQLVRIDGTFRFASSVHVNVPGTFKGERKRNYKKVATAVLVAVGLEGLCLCTPELVPAEDARSTTRVVQSILEARRSVLGSLSAPAAFVTDSIRQHQSALRVALNTVYPEHAIATAGKGDNADVLMLQDIAHREWAFTRKAAPKRHPDYNAYVGCIRDIFHQLREPHDDAVHGPQALSDKERDWKRDARGNGEGTGGLAGSLQRSILEGEHANASDDHITKETLRMLGNAATTALASLLGTYIPRRVLRNAARRMNMTLAEVDDLFPDHGYADGTDFLVHLKGVNEFFSTVRAPSNVVGSTAVVSSLARTRAGVNTVANDGRPKTETWDAIGDSQLAQEAIRGCEDKVTLDGLLGHRFIEGINTEEAIVEAFNRQMNANTRMGCIGYDVAKMRLSYHRLKWDSAAIQRILYGDKSRKRRPNAQVMAVWNTARTMLSQKRGPIFFKNKRLSEVERTTPAHLLAMGYRLRSAGSQWSDEDVKIFFEAATQVNRTPEVLGTYRNVYDWMAVSIFKGAKSQTQVREFAETLYGRRKRKRKFYELGPEYAPAPTNTTNDNENKNSGDDDMEPEGVDQAGEPLEEVDEWEQFREEDQYFA